MTDGKIELFDTGILILELEVPKREVAQYLRSVPDDDRALAVVQAIEVGVFCLERARAGQSLDFVRREIDALLNSVQRGVEKIPEETQKGLAAKIGTGEGQVLAPVQSLVNDVSKAAGEKIKEIRELLQQEIDPAKETSTLGKALRALRDLLDPRRTDSVQGSLDSAITQITSDGGLLARAVKDVVAATLKPLEDKVNDLAKEVRGREAAADALEQTTQKGTSYEDEVVRLLQDWAQRTGAEVSHVGADNRPGDVVVAVGDSSITDVNLRVVVEARDRQSPLGRMAIADTLNTAMSERSANAGVYITRTREGLAREIGEWAEGACDGGCWVACAHEHLVTAVRFLIVQERLQSLRASAPSVDALSIEAQVQRIRTALGRVKTINTKVTEVRAGADEIQREAESIRGEIRGALSEMEDALRTPSAQAQARAKPQ